ncbi:MAG: cell wall-binding repeat-containing protein, partial [Actinomycetota bacterium]|nr:cell wall-binding repeat-containing protein [Actinomycetota bacterium]
GDQTVITLYPGTTKLEHRARDAAGNESTWKFRNFSITTKQTPVQGDNRYATAIAASKQVYPGKMPAGPDGNRTVVIASGANWPDALGASGLAGAHRGPLLLTDPTTLPSAVAKQILDLGADRAIIVGGTGAVSTGVQASVASAVGGSSRVTRIPGANRYATSDAIGAKVVSVPGRDAWDGTAFVATGENFPDALAAAPLAAAKGYPLYLAPRTGISPSTVSAMKAAGVKQVVLLGGTSVVTATTQSRITGAGITVSGRWAGADRYSTARDVATKSLARGLTTRNVALATGQNFPDALAGGVMQGLTGSIMVLTTSDVLHAQAEALLGANAASVGEVRFIGGPAALSSAVRNKAMVVVGP